MRKTLFVILCVLQLQAQDLSLSKSDTRSTSTEKRQLTGTQSGQPSSRSERWRIRRLKKRQKRVVLQPSRFQNWLIHLESKGFESLVGYKNFHARLGDITTGSGLSPEVRYWKPAIKGSPLTFQGSATYSIRQYQNYSFQFGKNPSRQDFIFWPNSSGRGTVQLDEPQPQTRTFFLYTDFHYRDLPQEDFFGLGPHSKESDRTDFRFTNVSYDAVSGYRFNTWLTASTRLGYMKMDVRPGEDDNFLDTQTVFTDSTTPGLNHQPDLLHWSANVRIDLRDRPDNPHRGGLLGLSFSRFDDRGGNHFTFTRFASDARYFMTLGSDQRVMAFRFFTSLNDEVGKSRIPFYLQETLGGNNTLRGFRSFRFRGENLLFLSFEYRWEASPALELALFFDQGKVFQRRADFDLKSLERGFGVGLRLKTLQSVLMRLDLARSREHGLRLHLKFGHSF